MALCFCSGHCKNRKKLKYHWATFIHSHKFTVMMSYRDKAIHCVYIVWTLLCVSQDCILETGVTPQLKQPGPCFPIRGPQPQPQSYIFHDPVNHLLCCGQTELDKHSNMLSAWALWIFASWNDQTAPHLRLSRSSHATCGGKERRCIGVYTSSVKFCIPRSITVLSYECDWQPREPYEHSALSKRCSFHKPVCVGLCPATRLRDEITQRENSVGRSHSFFTSPAHHLASSREWQQICARGECVKVGFCNH